MNEKVLLVIGASSDIGMSLIDRISKNYIFFFDGDGGVIKMGENDGTVISNKFDESNNIFEEFKRITEGKTAYDFKSEKLVAKNNYEYLPSTFDFTQVKSEKVYKMEIKSYNEYKVIIDRYKLDFEDDDIEKKFEKNKIILFLTKYNISNYKVNIGNIKIDFERL